MSEIFKDIPVIKYEGPDSKNPFAFKYYDPDRVILGKTMKEHLPFAMAWWHNLGANGVDMFGRGTIDKSFGASEEGTMEHAKAKVDAGIEFMQKLGIKYYCFHDVDLVPEADDINDTFLPIHFIIQPFFEFLNRKWLIIMISLSYVTVVFPKNLDLFCSLNALHNTFHPKILSK